MSFLSFLIFTGFSSRNSLGLNFLLSSYLASLSSFLSSRVARISSYFLEYSICSRNFALFGSFDDFPVYEIEDCRAEAFAGAALVLSNPNIFYQNRKIKFIR